MESNAITVAVRIRPLSTSEALLLREEPAAASSSTSYISGRTPPSFIRRVVKACDDRVLVFDPPETSPVASYQRSILGPNAKKTKDIRFCFDRVFDENAGQQDVFDGCASELVPGVLDGFNGTVFAYGATGCGKTHTISGSPSQPGIVFLLMKDLYDRIAAKKDQVTCEVSISYLEIYNETIRDLLVSPSASSTLGLRESDGKVVVPGLSEKSPSSAEEVVQVIMEANANRTVSATEANAVSSRSHAVLCVNVTQRPRTAAMSEQVTSATLSVIDLAGSERASVTKNRGDRLIEGANINRSLLALGNCINALCDAKKQNHIPYRDSKLTRLLKHSLGGNCRTVMVVCVSPSSHHYDESFNTLQYANRAKEIKTKVTRNVVSVDRHVSQYVRVIYELRSELEARKASDSEREARLREDIRAVHAKATQEVDEVLDRIRKAYEDAKPRLVSAGSLKMQLALLKTANAALQKWKNDVFPASKHAEPTYIYTLDGIVSAYSSQIQTLETELGQITNAKAMLDANVASASRKVTNAAGPIATQYPELVRLLDTSLRVHELELDLATSFAAERDRAAHSVILSDLMTCLETVTDKVQADLSITPTEDTARREQLSSLLEFTKTATANLTAQIMASGAAAPSVSPPARLPSITVPAVSRPPQAANPGTLLSKKRSSMMRSPLPDAPSSAAARPGKVQRASLASASATGSALKSSKPVLKPSALARKVSNASIGSSSVASVKKEKEDVKGKGKGVAWKDDRGEKLTEEHSKSIIEYSDTSAEMSGNASSLMAPSPALRPFKLKPMRASSGPAEPAKPAVRRIGSGLSKPTQERIEEEDESLSIEDASRVLAEKANDSIASSVDSSFASDNTTIAALPTTIKAKSKPPVRTGLALKARSSIVSKMALTPKRASAPYTKRHSIGPIRSAKKSRVSYVPGIDAPPLPVRASIGTGMGASRVTESFKNRIAAQAAESAARPASSTGFERPLTGVQARVAAARARRESMATAALALPSSSTGSAPSRGFDMSFQLGNVSSSSAK